MRGEAKAMAERFFEETSGQAMTEYAIIIFLIFVFGATAGFTFFTDFMTALQKYYDSYYLMLNLPFP
jgi:Flp pilus assembly pilin Flp